MPLFDTEWRKRKRAYQEAHKAYFANQGQTLDNLNTWGAAVKAAEDYLDTIKGLPDTNKKDTRRRRSYLTQEQSSIGDARAKLAASAQQAHAAKKAIAPPTTSIHANEAKSAPTRSNVATTMQRMLLAAEPPSPTAPKPNDSNVAAVQSATIAAVSGARDIAAGPIHDAGVTLDSHEKYSKQSEKVLLLPNNEGSAQTAVGSLARLRNDAGTYQSMGYTPPGVSSASQPKPSRSGFFCCCKSTTGKEDIDLDKTKRATVATP